MQWHRQHHHNIVCIVLRDTNPVCYMCSVYATKWTNQSGHELHVETQRKHPPSCSNRSPKAMLATFLQFKLLSMLGLVPPIILSVLPNSFYGDVLAWRAAWKPQTCLNKRRSEADGMTGEAIDLSETWRFVSKHWRSLPLACHVSVTYWRLTGSDFSAKTCDVDEKIELWVVDSCFMYSCYGALKDV